MPFKAIVAGLLDVVASPSRVESGRINDPSRKYPVLLKVYAKRTKKADTSVANSIPDFRRSAVILLPYVKSSRTRGRKR